MFRKLTLKEEKWFSYKKNCLDEKNVVICLVIMFAPDGHFLCFLAMTAKNSSMYKRGV